jgi:hypothetical protein
MTVIGLNIKRVLDQHASLIGAGAEDYTADEGIASETINQLAAEELDVLTKAIDLIVSCRAAQRIYFRDRQQETLTECIRLERMVDDALADITGKNHSPGQAAMPF